MEFEGFDWDDGNWPKCGKHGVSKRTIEALFDDERTKVMLDPKHGLETEDRYLAVGLAIEGHAGLFVGFTLRQRDGLTLVRPLTARFMHAREAARYARF